MRQKSFYKENIHCWICGLPIPITANIHHPLSGTIDHVIPRAFGGVDSAVNRKPAHRSCNLMRGVQCVDEDMSKRAREAALSRFRESPHLIPHGKKYRKLREIVHFMLQNIPAN